MEGRWVSGHFLSGQTGCTPAELIPCSRQSSATGTPPSVCFNIPIIWGSLDLLIFISNLLVHSAEKILLLNPTNFRGDYHLRWCDFVNCGIIGSYIRDMMLEAVEKRFGALRAPETIEMLSDNGSAYIAKETIIFAGQLNLKSCFTPVKSPQSNGMSEAFVKTFKRDYVYINPLPNAETVLKLIAEWFEDYNENHPHSGLKMRSPREFRSAQTATA